ncbi:MAG TPA: TIGR04551 family protein [Polyangiales bacterium]|nr:TIGR04551 family protein [Polyangiales bacterium]
MRLSTIVCLLALVGLPSVIKAQPSPSQTPSQNLNQEKLRPPTLPTAGSGAAPTAGASAAAPEQTPPAADEPAAAPDGSAEPEPAAPPETVTAEPAPAAAPSGLSPAPAGVAPDDTAAPTTPELSIPSPGELGDRLAGDLPAPEEKRSVVAPSPIVTLHGYMRARGEFMDRFWLGRGIIKMNDTSEPDPFSRFRPLERSDNQTMCAGENVGGDGSLTTVCKVKTLQFANMRFRFSPQLNISEDIRIKSTFDILDNYVLGDGPASYYGTGKVATATFPGTNIPTGTLILPRRVWAEVRNRDLGELRFGLMPDQWGLGMLANAGNGIDDDYSTDVGRVMGTTKLLGFYLSAAYDFVNEGRLGTGSNVDRPGYDGSQLNDFDQYTFSVVRRIPDEDEEAVLARGDAVLNGGARFQLSSQDSIIGENNQLRDLKSTLYTPDVWAQLRVGKLRLEIEGAWIVGSLLNTNNDNRSKQYVSQFGAAFESELRLLNDKLGLYVYAGGASGDSEVEGLSSDANFIDHAGARADKALNNSRVSTFRFHPAYRVDLILWRNIMRQITGAMYVKPGVSYDFVKDSFGQLFGARVDLVYSRASSPVQTWGNDPNLGVEVDATVYWRSADGPNQNDGYHAMLQYGVLFPMRGLAYVNQGEGLSTAQTLRLLLGVMF